MADGREPTTDDQRPTTPVPTCGSRAESYPKMDARATVVIAANFLVIAGLLVYGFVLFGEYSAKGRWAKNITGLLAAFGMWALAFALEITPQNADELSRIAHSDAPMVLLGISSGLLLAAIAAFGIITYSRPLRLWHERQIQRDLDSELPKIP